MGYSLSEGTVFLFAVSSGVRVSEATVCRVVGRLRSRRKKRSRGAAERDEFLRVLWHME